MSSSISPRGLWGMHQPCLRSWTSQAALQVSGENKLDDPVALDAMQCTEFALGKVSLPLKACFILGKVVHVQFDGGS